MQLPLEITYRGVDKTDELESLVREKVGKLEQVHDRINGCRIALEKEQDRPRSGSPYRVRLDITVPPSHEIAVDRNPGEGTQYDPLETVIRNAFEAARRQLAELKERQQREVKSHPYQETAAIVTHLEGNYGFLRTLDTGREIYFHRNSVSDRDFERLEVGTGVQFAEEEGEMGPQATTVQIVDKPGARVSKPTETNVESPMGWQ